MTSIEESVFAFRYDFTSVTIPGSVTNIEQGAFTMCGVSSVSIENGVTSIGEGAFAYCMALDSVNIPASVTHIGDWAFQNCYALESVTGLRDDMDVAATAFRGTPFDANRPFRLDVRDGVLVGMQGTCPAVLSIPDGVTAIDENAFSRWSYEIPDDGDPYSASWHSAVDALETVFVPASVEKIGLYAFGGCANLSRVEIANPDVMIDGGAFYECTGLASLGIQKSGFSLAGWNGVCYEPWEIREYDYEQGDMVSITNFAEGTEIRMGPAIDFMTDGFVVDGSIGEINENYGLFWFTAVWEMVAALPTVASDAAPEAVTNAIESAGFADAAEVKRAIDGSAEKYAAFKEWAQRVKHPGGSPSSATVAGEAAVVANTNAAAAFMLGAERLFEKAPKIEFGDVAVATSVPLPEGGEQGTSRPAEVTVSVVVKDGEEAVRCAAEKVKEMFEATSDLGDWNGGAKMTPTVTVEDGEGATMRFKVTPGDGSATRAFLRVKVK